MEVPAPVSPQRLLVYPTPPEKQPGPAEPKVHCVLEASQGQACDKEQITHLALPSPAAGTAPRPGRWDVASAGPAGVTRDVLNSIELL